MSTLFSTKVTGADYDKLPWDEGRQWELVEGELIPVPSASFKHQEIVEELSWAIGTFLRNNRGIGKVISDFEFALNADTRLRPDVLFVRMSRAQEIDPDRVPAPGAPDLAVEVISPSERPGDIRTKLLAYLRLGTEEVWQVFPVSRSIVIHRDGRSETITTGAITTPLLPGFSVEVESLFP